MSSCLWYFCSRNQTCLDKSKRHLTQIPKDISRLEKHLLELNLQCNQIKKLDKILFRCKKLERLYLNNNNIQEIPDDIGELTRLEEIYLAYNELTEISQNIRLCEKLVYLDLSSNSLMQIPDAITQLRNLQVLLFNEVSLTQIPSSISSLCNLRILEARDNLIHSIPESISFLSKLVRLDLGSNEILDLPETIGQLECLDELWLDNNILNQLPKEIGDLKNLEILELSNNPLHHLPNSLCNLEKLTDLTLTSNPIAELPEDIGKLKELRILKVDFNQLKTLPDSICELNNLTDFYISGNSLSCFPEQFGKLKSLRCLHADYNVLCSLPDSICECKELSIFSLRDNWIEVLPTNIGNLSKLTVLDLSGNKLKFLPFSVSKLKKIRAIWLSKTQQKSMYALQTDNDSQYGKVLTNFLLPQRSSKHSPTSSFIDTDNESNHQRERKWRPSECYAAEKKTSIFKSENVDDDQSQTMTNKINELCLLNSVKDLDSKLSEDIKQQKNVHFEIETIEDFSIDYVKYYTDTIGSYGIEIEELDTINLNTFGTSESSIIIKKIHPDSSADRLNKLREGDRILEINEISLTNLPLKAALPLLQLKGLELDLLIRHDPPLAHFKKIIIDRENGNIKLGLGVKRMPLTQKSSIQLLTIFNLDDAVPQIETNLKLDDIIIETNDIMMMDKTGEDFKNIIQDKEQIQLVIYRKSLET